MRSQSIFSFFVILSILLFGWSIQQDLLLRGDVSAILHETVKLWAGGKYGKDFFEPNPPMIFFLYTPAVFLWKFFSLNFVLAFRLYVFILSIFSISLSFLLLKKIFCRTNQVIQAIFVLFALAIVFFLLPFGEFGQREHLLILLITPYVLLVINRLENHFIPLSLVLPIAFLGFAGFVVKPHYVLTFVLIEFYFLVNQNAWRALFRPETIVIYSMSILYVASIFIFFSEYVFQIVPLVARYYYSGLGVAYHQLIFSDLSVFCFFPFVLYGLFQKTQSNFSKIFLVVLCSLLLTYFIQDTEWYYHILPAFSVAIVLLVYDFVILLQNKFSKEDYFKVFVLSLIFLLYLTHAENVGWHVIVFMPYVFFGYFGLLFLGFFYLAAPKQSIFKICIFTSLSCLLSFVFTTMAKQTPWYVHRFSLTIILLLLMFLFFVSEQNIKKIQSFFLIVMGIILFAFPTYTGISMLYAGMLAKEKSVPLIHFLNEYAENKSIVFFSSNIEGYPLIDYGKNVQYASRYPFLIWVPSLLFNPNNLLVKNYYINSIAQELNVHKPDYVFVDVKKFKTNLNYTPFEFIPYFSDNQNFRIAWRSYSYFSTLEVSPLFKFRVYKRSA